LQLKARKPTTTRSKYNLNWQRIHTILLNHLLIHLSELNNPNTTLSRHNTTWYIVLHHGDNENWTSANWLSHFSDVADRQLISCISTMEAQQQWSTHHHTLTIQTGLDIIDAWSHYTVVPRCSCRKASVMYALSSDTLQLICSTPWLLLSLSKNSVTPDNTSQT